MAQRNHIYQCPPTQSPLKSEEAKIDFDLSDATISPCAEDARLLKVNTVLGYVLLSQGWLSKHGSEPLSWVCHISPFLGCHWCVADLEEEEDSCSTTSPPELSSSCNPPAPSYPP
uniref:Uncharacterized protein n=1 Tax=Ditylenchus dipsaci TaxID=166011 RepID=A0A915DL36_9BILA